MTVDLLISYAGSDRPWAEWVAWQLAEAGYTVELDVWRWRAGRNFVTAMSDALDSCGRVVALFSPAYFDRARYTTGEWAASLVRAPGQAEGRLIPVRIQEVPHANVPAILRALVAPTLFGLPEHEARRVLIEAVRGPGQPTASPPFPVAEAPGALARLGGTGPRLPGSMPRVWNIPNGSPWFTGRDGLIVELRERLVTGGRPVAQALHGMGGVGKTQLAIEYANRFAGAYELAWWIHAEQTGLIGDQFAALGVQLGCIEAGAGSEAVRSAILGELRERGRWLLVFDNAEHPDHVRDWLPGGSGHVLITTREQQMADIATPIGVDVLTRPESVTVLRARVSRLGEADANDLAEDLGDLPLAIAQAASFIAETRIGAAGFRRVLKERTMQILAKGLPVDYPHPLVAVIQVAADKLATDAPGAAELANLCALMAPDPIPLGLFTSSAGELPTALASQVTDVLDWRQTLACLARQSLAQIDEDELQMHRLTQAILHFSLKPEEEAAARACVEAILAAVNPGSPDDPGTWPQWARLIPHLLAVDPVGTDNPALRAKAVEACWYLLARGDTPEYSLTREDNPGLVTGLQGSELANDLYWRWREERGADDPDTLKAANFLAWALWHSGDYAAARQLDEDTLARRRRTLGADHPDTLASASNLAATLSILGELDAARQLDEDTLAHRRRVLGPDNPKTLATASNLAALLGLLGEFEAARELDEGTLGRLRTVLGKDHPDTLTTASNLSFTLGKLHDVRARELGEDTLDRLRATMGADHQLTLSAACDLALTLRELGETGAARELQEDTLARRRRVMGENNPDTLQAARDLVATLRELGENRAARELDEDTQARSRDTLNEAG